MFEYLDYIYEVYKEKNFSRAAEKLFISQSSLSLTIKHAEQQIGAEIFNRKTKPISLTDFGLEYIKACEQILALRKGLENYVYDTNNLRKGTLSIGAGNFLATYLVAPFVAHFKERYPNININLVEGRSIDLRSSLEKGDLDMLVTNADFKSSELDRRVLFQERLLLTVPASKVEDEDLKAQSLSIKDLVRRDYNHPRPEKLSALEGLPFIGLRPGNDTRIRTDAIFKQHNIYADYFMELDQSSTTFLIASNMSAVCLVADTVIRTLWNGQQICIYNLESNFADRDVCIYTNASKYQTTIQQRFLEMFEQEAINLL